MTRKAMLKAAGALLVVLLALLGCHAAATPHDKSAAIAPRRPTLPQPIFTPQLLPLPSYPAFDPNLPPPLRSPDHPTFTPAPTWLSAGTKVAFDKHSMAALQQSSVEVGSEAEPTKWLSAINLDSNKAQILPDYSKTDYYSYEARHAQGILGWIDNPHFGAEANLPH